MQNTIALITQVDGDLQQVEHLACVTIGCHRQTPLLRFGKLYAAGAQPTFRVGQRCVNHSDQSIVIERLEHIHPCSRQQGVIQFKRRILGGGADEDQRAVLDMRKKGILLTLVETMHLVHEQNRGAAIDLAQILRPLDSGADILDPRQYRRQAFEFPTAGLGDESCQSGLTNSRRPPQNHGVRQALADGLAQ